MVWRCGGSGVVEWGECRLGLLWCVGLLRWDDLRLVVLRVRVWGCFG